MSHEDLPEDKLLNLIRNGKAKDSSEKKGLSPSSVGPKPLRPVQEKKARNFLGPINRLMLIVVAGLLGYLCYELFYESKAEESILETAASQPAQPVTVIALEEKPLSYYENQIKKRDIFERPKQGVVATAADNALSKNFRLVGIVLGETPEAIVEDVLGKRTLFLHVGDKVEEAEIILIEEGKVTFFYQEEEFELTQ
ncbi:MAG: hypothetical protein P9M07_06210 [Candidatus Aceula meridiana]|nr:hypothetical protein [Candidatus Aceula meridiana]